MWNAGHGFMAIWSDVSPDDFDFYHHWLLKEHFQERVGVPGFIAARVFPAQTRFNLAFFNHLRDGIAGGAGEPRLCGETQQPDADDATGHAEAEEFCPRRRPCRAVEWRLRRRDGKGHAV